jgi:tRNA-dihydrouridine synthase
MNDELRKILKEHNENLAAHKTHLDHVTHVTKRFVSILNAMIDGRAFEDLTPLEVRLFLTSTELCEAISDAMRDRQEDINTTIKIVEAVYSEVE